MNVCASCIFAEFDKERKFMWDESPSKKSFQPEGTDECGKCNKEVGYEEICNDNEETWRKSAGRKFIWKQDGRRQVVVFCKKCISQSFEKTITSRLREVGMTGAKIYKKRRLDC